MKQPRRGKRRTASARRGQRHGPATALKEPNATGVSAAAAGGESGDAQIAEGKRRGDRGVLGALAQIPLRRAPTGIDHRVYIGVESVEQTDIVVAGTVVAAVREP